MNTELDILLNIYTDMNINLDHIQTSRKRMLQIAEDIKLLNNTYFENIDNTLFKEYIHMFYDDADSYKEIVNNLDNLKSFVKELIDKKCEHEWIDDTIDIDLDGTQNICYCIKCEITKK